MPTGTPIVITVHGIRTFGAWQERLQNLLRDVNPDIDIKSYRYGYFSVVAFLIPIFRWLAVLAFRRRFRDVIRDNPGSVISIVCHSFGTHIVAYALRGMRPDEMPIIPTLILSGSVLRSNFNWHRLRATGKIGLIVNDCGTKDGILLLSQMLVLFTGMAGRVGFYGFTDEHVVNRYFTGGHSHYFQPVSDNPDSFMRQWWVPILAKIERPKPGSSLTTRGLLQGLVHALTRIADPIKIGLYGGLIAVLVFFGYVQPRREAALEQGRRAYQAAAGQIGSDRLVPDAVASLARLINAKTFTSRNEQTRVADLARFGLQRLHTADQVLANVPLGGFFRWSGKLYFKGTQLARVDMPTPLAQFRHSEAGVSILITEKVLNAEQNEKRIELVVFDVQRSTESMRVPIEHAGRLGRGFVAHAIGADPNRMLVTFTVSEIEGDNSRTHYVAIDMARLTGKASIHDDLRFHSNVRIWATPIPDRRRLRSTTIFVFIPTARISLGSTMTTTQKNRSRSRHGTFSSLVRRLGTRSRDTRPHPSTIRAAFQRSVGPHSTLRGFPPCNFLGQGPNAISSKSLTLWRPKLPRPR